MTCTTSGPVELGSAPLPLSVYVRAGEDWSDSIVLVAVASDGTETVTAWPEAPVLQFGPEDAPDLEVTAVLSEDQDTSTTDALASWSMSTEQTAGLKAYTAARVLVTGRTWLEGNVDD